MVDSTTRQPRSCHVCGAELQENHRYCWNCGTPSQQPPLSPDPSTLETRRFRALETPARDADGSMPTGLPAYPSGPSDEATVFEGRPPGFAVPPETGNRTLWIILGIVAVVVLVCCCLLPLILLFVANTDHSLQEEIRRAIEAAVVF